jgi:thymidylate kinase
VEEFEARGYRVMDEAFMDMPSYALPAQSLLMETSWVCSWFERVLRLASRVRHEKTGVAARQYVYIADRSPFSAVFYARHGKLLDPVIREQMREVQEFSAIQFYTVNISVEPELLWSRITERLEREPERVRFNEHKRSWMDKTLAFYDSFPWDMRVENDDRSIAQVCDSIVAELRERDADFCEWILRKKTAHTSVFDSSYASTDSDEELQLLDVLGNNNNNGAARSHVSSARSDASASPVASTNKAYQPQPEPSNQPMPSIISFNNCFEDLDF